MRRAGVSAFAALLTAALLLIPALALEAPRWRSVKAKYSDFEIRADPRISRNPRLVPILQQALSRFEGEARDEDAFVREELERHKKQGTVWPIKRGTQTEEFYLLGMTGRYAAFFGKNAMCAVGQPAATRPSTQ